MCVYGFFWIHYYTCYRQTARGSYCDKGPKSLTVLYVFGQPCTPRLRIGRKEQNVLGWTLIATGVVLQIQLVVFLGIPPLTDGRDDSLERLLPPFLFDFFADGLCYLALLVVMGEYDASVLGPDIRALSIGSGRVMYTVEELDELAIRHNGRVVLDA